MERVGPVDSSLAQFAGVVQLDRLETLAAVVADDAVEVASQLPSVVVVASAMYHGSFASDAAVVD